MSYIHQHGIRAISAQRFDEASRSDDACWVVEEETLTIDVEGIGAYTLMWTPTEPVAAPCGFTPGDGVLAEGGVPEVLALAAGFSFTEGLFDRIGDIRSLAVCPENPGVVRLALADRGCVETREFQGRYGKRDRAVPPIWGQRQPEASLEEGRRGIC